MHYLGIDFGLKRVGLAISEGSLASPYKIIVISNLQDAMDKIVKITRSENFDKIVVGMPEGVMGKAVSKFVKAMRGEGILVEIADETLSSKTADKLLIEMGVSQKKRKLNDSQAAAIILQNYLEEKV